MRRSLVLVFTITLALAAILSLLLSSRHLARLSTVSSSGAKATRAAAAPLAPGAAEERACAALLSATSNIMFMVLGGRGYHAVRVRTILHSWARCVKHVFVFTDPSVNISGYTSARRFVYLSAGDAWRRRPYLPMTHMEAVGRLLSRPNSPASKVGWFFLVTDRTFVDVHALLRLLPDLDASKKGYFGALADSAHKEAFGFHDYIDLNMGVLLSSTLLERIVDPEECHDQKSAGGTFDMFDAKLGNCVYYLGTAPERLRGFIEAEPPLACAAGGGVGGVVSFGKVEPHQMVDLSSCAGAISPHLPTSPRISHISSYIAPSMGFAHHPCRTRPI